MCSAKYDVGMQTHFKNQNSINIKLKSYLGIILRDRKTSS